MTSIISRVFTIVLSSAALIACVSDTGERHHFETTTDGSVITATSSEIPQFQDELFIYTKLFQVRSDPENIDSILERPYGMLMGDDGCLYISDDSRRQVLQFDQEGTFTRAFGRDGRGPGEFQSLNLLGVYGDTLCVYDMVIGRTTRYLTSGDLIDVITLPHNMPRGYASTAVQEFYPLQEGKRLSIERSLQSGTHYQFRAALLSSDSDTLWSGATPSLRTFYRVEAPPGFSVPILGIIYGPEPALMYHREIGIVISPGNRPELNIYSEEGLLIRRIHVNIQPQPVTAIEKKRVTDLLDQRIAEAEGPMVAMLRAERDGLMFAETKPAWTTVRTDDLGYFWLTIPETTQERRDAGGIKHRVLSPEGRYLGDTRWPTTSFSARVSRGYLLVVETDEETGEPLPTVYSIRPAIAGFRYP